MLYQVVEKDGFGTDWQPVRYEAYAMGRFKTEQEATEAAVKYLNSINMDNVLTAEEKARNFEAFMMTADGVCLGTLNGEPVFLKDGRTKQVVAKRDYYMLSDKTEVAVMPIRGT